MSVVAVEGELSIYRAAELKAQLLPQAGTGEVVLDLSQVSEIDTAGVQLLLLSQREAAALSRPWRLGAASPAVAEALNLLGLGALLPATEEAAA
jgi:anti-anti-sigma factor